MLSESSILTLMIIFKVKTNDYYISVRISISIQKLTIAPFRQTNIFSNIHFIVFKRSRFATQFQCSNRSINSSLCEISSNNCKILMVWFGQAIYHTSRRIFQPHNLRLTYRLVLLNRVSKLVLLNTIKPIFKNVFFYLHKWLRSIFGFLQVT